MPIPALQAMAKRKRSAVALTPIANDSIPHPPVLKTASTPPLPPMPRLRSQKQTRLPRVADNATTNSDLNPAMLGGGVALWASPDEHANEDTVPVVVE